MLYVFFDRKRPPKDMFTKLVKCNLGWVLAYYDRNGKWINVYTGKELQNVTDWTPLPR